MANFAKPVDDTEVSFVVSKNPTFLSKRFMMPKRGGFDVSRRISASAISSANAM